MLCYQSRRSAIDVLHDAVNWLAANRRMVGLTLVILLPIIVVIDLLIMPWPVYNDSYLLYYYDDPLVIIKFICDHLKDNSFTQQLILLGVPAFVATWMLTSQLSRYFYWKYTVRHASFKSIFRSMIKDGWRWLLCATLIALTASLQNFFLILAAIIIAAYLIPPIIMHNNLPGNVSTHLWLKLKTLFFALIFIGIITALPAFIFLLITILITFINELMPIIESTATLVQIYVTFLQLSMTVTLCLGIMLGLTTTLLLYGAINHED